MHQQLMAIVSALQQLACSVLHFINKESVICLTEYKTGSETIFSGGTHCACSPGDWIPTHVKLRTEPGLVLGAVCCAAIVSTLSDALIWLTIP